jgi:hypothetical protein
MKCKRCGTVVGANLCVRDLFEVIGKVIRGVADKESYTVHTINIISQRQYFVAAHCLISYVSTVFGSHSICLFSFSLQASDVGKMHRFAPNYSNACDLF